MGKDDNTLLQKRKISAKEINLFLILHSLGIATNGMEWVYDFDKKNLIGKMLFFIQTYKDLLQRNDRSWSGLIKWSEYLKGLFNRKQDIPFNKKLSIYSIYRPFVKKFYYSERFLSDRLTQNHYDIFGNELK